MGAPGRRAFRGRPWSSSASFAVVRAFSAEVVLSLSAHAVSAAAVNHTRIGRSSTRSGRSSQESKNQSIDKERVSQILARCSEEAPAPRRPSVQRKSELTRCITETGYQPHHVGTTDHYDVKARGRGGGGGWGAHKIGLMFWPIWNLGSWWVARSVDLLRPPSPTCN